MTFLSELKPDPKNPRKITEPKLAALKKAITKFGDLGGFVYNVQLSKMMGGHQRAKLFPKSEIHITKTYDTPTRTGTIREGFVRLNGERFKYREVKWDEKVHKAASIAANNNAGEWDTDILSEWLKDLEKDSFDLELTMFDKSEREEYFVEDNKSSDAEDEVPAAPKKAITKLGNVIQLGRHRLMCGDSTSIDAVERLMGGEKADMVYTDPPYGMNLDTDFSKMVQRDGRAGNIFRPVIGDDQDFDPGILLGHFDYCKEVFLWGADYYRQFLPKGGSWVVWDKRESSNTGSQVSEKMFGSMFELCWSKTSHKRDIARILWAGGLGEGIDEDRKGRNNSIDRCHPTQKPIKLSEWFFERWGKTENKVVDLFGGSGSTLIACEKTNRHCFMMELDPRYCDVIVERWEKFTGKKAKR